MEAYTEFAQVYDRFMDNVPYEAWCEGISKILTEHGISEGLVLDLGCGTGTMTRLLRQKGYDMIGVDASAEMLEIARNHPDEGMHNYLDQNGVFIFDMNTIHKYRDLIGDATICENREEGSFIWENYFDEESSINEYALTLFVKQENGLFARFEEFHYQRAYELQRVATLLEQAGLTLKAVCAEGTTDPADENCERAYFVAVRTQPHVF